MSTTRPVEIRLGAVKRLTKELLTRRIDVETEKARLDRFIAEGKDRWDVGKQVCTSFHAKLTGRVEGSPR
jgi:Tubulin binding cofactor A